MTGDDMNRQVRFILDVAGAIRLDVARVGQVAVANVWLQFEEDERISDADRYLIRDAWLFLSQPVGDGAVREVAV